VAKLQRRLDKFKNAFESGATPYNASREATEGITDAEIAAAICYLDPERRAIGRNNKDDSAWAICASLLIIVAGIAGYVLFYLRIS